MSKETNEFVARLIQNTRNTETLQTIIETCKDMHKMDVLRENTFKILNHPNCTAQVYHSFVATFPEQKNEIDAMYKPEKKSPSEQFFGEKMQIHEPAIVSTEKKDAITKTFEREDASRETCVGILDFGPQSEATIAHLTSDNDKLQIIINLSNKIKEEQAKVQSVWDEVKSQLSEDVKANTEICTHHHYNERYEYIEIRTLDEEVQSLSNWHPDFKECSPEEINEILKEKVIIYHEDSDVNGDLSNEAVYHKNFDDLLRYHENILYRDAVNHYVTVPPEFSDDIEEKYGIEIYKVYNALLTFCSNIAEYTHDLKEQLPDDTIAHSIINNITISTESNNSSLRAVNQNPEKDAEEPER